MWINGLNGGGGNLGLWTPAMMTTSLWLDAGTDSTITDVGGNCDVLADRSGNGIDATVVTASRRPLIVTNGLNGLTILRFDGSSDAMRMLGAVAMTNNVSEANTFFAGKVTANASATYARVFNYSHGSALSTSFRHSLSVVSNTARIGQRRLDADAAYLHDYAYSSTRAFIHQTRSLWSSATANYRVDGGSEVSAATGHSTGSTSATDSTEVHIGGNSYSGNQWCSNGSKPLKGMCSSCTNIL